MFFLNAILSVSARFTPCLVQRYGSGFKATEHFAEIAIAYGLQSLHRPTVEHTQAFFLLGLAEWGGGDKNRSNV